MMAVVLFIPNMNNLTGVLIILAVGIAISAWVMMGREKFSYAGLQMAVAFSMTVLQEPHAATELHVIRGRMVGIFLGIIAMRFAFVIGTEMKSKNSIASAPFSLRLKKGNHEIQSAGLLLRGLLNSALPHSDETPGAGQAGFLED
jgi:hypothetical protein